jgi:hypothetical protein
MVYLAACARNGLASWRGKCLLVLRIPCNGRTKGGSRFEQARPLLDSEPNVLTRQEGVAHQNGQARPKNRGETGAVEPF